MPGLGELFAKVRYDVVDERTGDVSTFSIDGLTPDFPSDGYRGGMGIPGAWRAAVLLSDLLGGVPWHAYLPRAGAERGLRRVTPGPLLLEQPDPPETRMTTFSSWALDLLWHGNAVGLLTARDRDGTPTAALSVPATMVGVRRITRWIDSPLPIGELEYQIGGRSYGRDDVFHVKGPCQPGALRGMGVLEAHLNTLSLATEQARQARNLSQHGVPTGVLKSENADLDATMAGELKAGWLRSQRDRTVAVLNATTSFQPIAWNPEELQLVEARKFSLHELALIFGLDPSWLGAAQASRTYSNIETEAINLVKFSLGGHLARFEQALSAVLPPGMTVQADLDALLRADTTTRYQAHAVGIAAGFLRPSEAREIEDRPPDPRVDERWLGAAAQPAPVQAHLEVVPELPAGDPSDVPDQPTP